MLKTVKVPVLALNGELDLQAASKENLDLIGAGLKAGGNEDVMQHLSPTPSGAAVTLARMGKALDSDPFGSKLLVVNSDFGSVV